MTTKNKVEVIPFPKACGIGRGEDCCIFLTVGANGFCCERFGSLHDTLVARQPGMSAKRMPTDPYPYCMAFAKDKD